MASKYKYTCPLTGKKFKHIVDRDLWTELTTKEMNRKERKLKKIDNEKNKKV